MKKYAVIPEGTTGELIDLTIGKKYEIVGYWDELTILLGLRFTIVDDVGDKRDCLEKYCSFLNNQNWKIQQ